MRVGREKGGKKRKVGVGARARGVLLLKRLLELSQDLCKHTNVSLSSSRLVSSANHHSCARARSFVLSLFPSLTLFLYVAGFFNPPQAARVFLTHVHLQRYKHINTHTHEKHSQTLRLQSALSLIDLYFLIFTCSHLPYTFPS